MRLESHASHISLPLHVSGPAGLLGKAARRWQERSFFGAEAMRGEARLRSVEALVREREDKGTEAAQLQHL
eukprot:1340412-Amphidinium_carterae.2